MSEPVRKMSMVWRETPGMSAALEVARLVQAEIDASIARAWRAYERAHPSPECAAFLGQPCTCAGGAS